MHEDSMSEVRDSTQFKLKLARWAVVGLATLIAGHVAEVVFDNATKELKNKAEKNDE
jgi:hypothetical protein